MANKTYTGFEIPKWEADDGPMKKIHSKAAAAQTSWRKASEALDQDLRTPKESKPALRREIAHKTLREVRRMQNSLSAERVLIDAARAVHLRPGKDANPTRSREVRDYLRSLDAGKRQVVIAQAVADSDKEVLEAVHGAPRILELVSDEHLARVADALNPEKAAELEAREDALTHAEVSGRVVVAEIEAAGFGVGQFEAEERMERLKDQAAFDARESSETKPPERSSSLPDRRAAEAAQVAALKLETEARRLADEIVASASGEAA